MEYYTKSEIKRQIKEEITTTMNLSLKSDMHTYLNWYYPQIKTCFYIAIRLNIYSILETDKLFFKIDRYIRSEIGGGDQKCLN